MVQVLVSLQRMLLHRDTFNHLVYTLNVVDDIIELLGDPLGLSPSPNKAGAAGSAATAEEQAAQQAHSVLRTEANKVLDVIMDCDMSASTPEGEDGDDIDAYGSDGGEGKAADARQGRAQMGGGSRVANMTLGKFARQVRSQRFRTHNREWLDAIEHDLAAEAEGEAEERAFLREQRRRTAEAEGRSLSDEEDDEFDEQDKSIQRNSVYKKYKNTKLEKKKSLERRGKLLVYSKLDDAVREQIDIARKSEWSNYLRFDAVAPISDEQARQYKQAGVEALPMSWVDTNKNAGIPGAEPKYKSRLVARGDL